MHGLDERKRKGRLQEPERSRKKVKERNMLLGCPGRVLILIILFANLGTDGAYTEMYFTHGPVYGKLQVRSRPAFAHRTAIGIKRIRPAFAHRTAIRISRRDNGGGVFTRTTG